MLKMVYSSASVPHDFILDVLKKTDRRFYTDLPKRISQEELLAVSVLALNFQSISIASSWPIKTEDKMSNLFCDVCQKTVDSQKSLTRHRQRHKAMLTGRYPCIKCKKAFSQKSALDGHQRVHNGHRPFGCNVCASRFTDNSTLQKHVRIHNGEKPFACPSCSRTFTQSGNMFRHTKNHCRVSKRKHS